MNEDQQPCSDYQIIVLETLDGHWQSTLPGAAIEGNLPLGGSRLHVHLPDQAALRGFMNLLWNYNLTVVHVCRLDFCSPRDRGQADIGGKV